MRAWVIFALAFSHSAFADVLVYRQPAVLPVQRLLIAELANLSTSPFWELFVPFDNFTLPENGFDYEFAMGRSLL
jgi:hypothetical protein